MSAVVRWNPTNTLANNLFAPRFHRLFDEMLGSWPGQDDEQMTASSWLPSADVKETNEAFLVTVELPGLHKEDIEIALEQNVLTVSGERRFTKNEADEQVHRRERAYGKFSRSFRLPRNVDAGKVEAKFVDGVLNLSLPKTEEARPRQIAIS